MHTVDNDELIHTLEIIITKYKSEVAVFAVDLVAAMVSDLAHSLNRHSLT